MSRADHIEIEHKFLVSNDGWRSGDTGIRYRQGYVMRTGARTVRVRSGGGQGFLTIKGQRQGGGTRRAEYEYAIPVEDADAIIETFCNGYVVDKTRYRRPFAGMTWEIDEFHGANTGLVLAEIELDHEGQPFEKPDWVGTEVTHDDRYTNAMLAARPWSTWHHEGESR